jgi:hypothetical protein
MTAVSAMTAIVPMGIFALLAWIKRLAGARKATPQGNLD